MSRFAFLRRAWPALAIMLAATLLILGGVFDWLQIEALQREWSQLLAWSAARPVVLGVALASALTLLVASGLPGGVVILVAGGALFGTLAGAAIGLFGNTVGGTLLFLATRQLMAGGTGQAPRWVYRVRAGFERSPVAYALFLRLAPVFPFGAASIALAWLRCRPLMFVVTSALGVLPATLIFAALGAGLSGAFSSPEPVDAGILRLPSVWIPLVALGVLGSIAAWVGFVRGRRSAAVGVGPG